MPNLGSISQRANTDRANQQSVMQNNLPSQTPFCIIIIIIILMYIFIAQVNAKGAVQITTNNIAFLYSWWLLIIRWSCFCIYN